MRRRLLAVTALIALAGCTAPGRPAAPGTSAPPPAVASSSGASGFPTSDATPAAPLPDPSASPTDDASAAPEPGASASATPLGSPADSLEAAFAQPEAGGIGAFLAAHPDYLPGTATIGDVILSGASRGPFEVTLNDLPEGTTRVYMTLACASDSKYRMELLRSDGSVLGGSWSDDCGYWGGLHGYTTAPFPIDHPPTTFRIEVDPGVRYSYVLYAVPGR